MCPNSRFPCTQSVQTSKNSGAEDKKENKLKIYNLFPNSLSSATHFSPPKSGQKSSLVEDGQISAFCSEFIRERFRFDSRTIFLLRVLGTAGFLARCRILQRLCEMVFNGGGHRVL